MSMLLTSWSPDAVHEHEFDSLDMSRGLEGLLSSLVMKMELLLEAVRGRVLVQ